MKMLIKTISILLIQALTIANCALAGPELEASSECSMLSPIISSGSEQFQQGFTSFVKEKQLLEAARLIALPEFSYVISETEFGSGYKERKWLGELIESNDKDKLLFLLEEAYLKGKIAQREKTALSFAITHNAVAPGDLDVPLGEKNEFDRSYSATRCLLGRNEWEHGTSGAYQIIMEYLWEDGRIEYMRLREWILKKTEDIIIKDLTRFIRDFRSPLVDEILNEVFENWFQKKKNASRLKQNAIFFINNPGMRMEDVASNCNISKNGIQKQIRTLDKQILKVARQLGKDDKLVNALKNNVSNLNKELKFIMNSKISLKDLQELISPLIDEIGEKNLRLKELSFDQIKELIIRRLVYLESYLKLARSYGLQEASVNRFFEGRNWSNKKIEKKGAICKFREFLTREADNAALIYDKPVIYPAEKTRGPSFKKKQPNFYEDESSHKEDNLPVYIVSGEKFNDRGYLNINSFKIRFKQFANAVVEIKVINNIPRFIKFSKDSSGNLVLDKDGKPLTLEVFDEYGKKLNTRRQITDKYYLRIYLDYKGEGYLRCTYLEARDRVAEMIAGLKNVPLHPGSLQIRKKIRKIKKILWTIYPELKNNVEKTARYIASESGIKELYEISQNISMKGNFRTHLTFQSAFDALMSKPEDQRNFGSLNLSKRKGGDHSTLAACREYGILKKVKERSPSDVEKTYLALMQIPEEDRRVSKLARRKKDGGNATLLRAYYKFRKELKQLYNFSLPDVKNPGREAMSKPETLKFLETLPKEKQTPKQLKMNGLWKVYYACLKHDIPLPHEKDFSDYAERTPYENYRDKVLNEKKADQDIDPMILWYLMENQDNEKVRLELIEYFMPIVIKIIEGEKQERYISKTAQYYLDLDLSEANLAMIEAIDAWGPEMDLNLEEFVRVRIKEALKEKRSEYFKEKMTMQSINTPRGNKGGKNSSGKSGPFGGARDKTIEDAISSQDTLPDNALARFELMKTAIAGIKNEDYGFLKGTELQIDPEILIPRQTKERFAKDLRDYFLKKNISKKMPIDFAIWVMGSMGNVGLARKGESNVNLIVLTNAVNGQDKEALIALRNLIGNGVVYSGNEKNFFLEIGKKSSMISLALEAPDFVSLLEKYDLRYINNDNAASVEIMSLDSLGNGNNSALNRACFHVADNISGMGENGILVMESKPGFAETIKQKLKEEFYYDFDYQRDFASNYLIHFFSEQVIKLKNAQMPLSKRNKQPQAQKQIHHSAVNEDSYISFYLLNNKVHVEINNGSVSLRLIQPLNGEMKSRKKEWREFLLSFQGKEIFVDDPIINDDINEKTAALLELQSDQLYELLLEEQQEISNGIQLEQTRWHCTTIDFQEAILAQELAGFAI